MLIDQRLVKVEGAVLEVAQQRRFVVRYLKGLTEALEDNAKR